MNSEVAYFFKPMNNFGATFTTRQQSGIEMGY